MQWREFLFWLLGIPAVTTFLMTLALLLIYLYALKKDKNLVKINKTLPKTSILVPFYNEDSQTLITALNMLEAQNYPEQLQIVLIDDGSTNETPTAIQQWLTTRKKHDYTWLQCKKNGGRKGIALDFALASGKIKGEVYVVVDSDTFISPDGIYELVTKLWSDDRYAAVCGFISPENHKNSLLGKLQYYEHIGFYGAIRSAQDYLGVVPVLAGAFVAHRASVVHQIGGWGDWLVEDISWAWKALAAGYKTGYAAQAIASTQCPETYYGLFKQRRRWSRGRVEAFSSTWKTSVWKGLLFTPWFILTAFQFLFPPSLIMIIVLAILKMWPHLIIFSLTLFMYSIFIKIHAKKHGHRIGIKKNHLIFMPVSIATLEIMMWLPNILGYLDEFSGRKKLWLTR